MTALNADLDVNGALTVLRLVGDLDMAAASDVLAMTTAAVARPDLRTLVIDMSGVGFMDSVGIGTLVHTHALCAAHDAALQLHAVTPRVRKVLDITGLADWFGLPSDDGDQ
jgi:anti-anti-sigma factor